MSKTNPPTIASLLEQFPDEAACRAYLAARRWQDGIPRCPRCGHDKVSAVKAKPFHWQCRSCAKNGYRFSVLAGTIFENTNLPLRTWFQIVFIMTTAKKGMSALQIQRTLGIGSYETAWYACHRVRAAMKNEDFAKLSGVVEVDETYIGGKEKNKHRPRGKRGPDGQKPKSQGPAAGKTVVIGAIARKGSVTARIIEKTDAATLQGFVREVVADDVSLVATDDHQGYVGVGKTMPHESVAHSRKEYVRGNVHTGTIDGFWSLIKRGIMGSFHHVSVEYLPLYLNEFAFRNNNRGSADMFATVIANA